MTNITYIFQIPHVNETTDVLGYANLYADSMLIHLILIVIWAIFYYYYNRNDSRYAFVGANTITMVLALPFVFIKFMGQPLLPIASISVIIILFLVSVVMLYMERSP